MDCPEETALLAAVQNLNLAPPSANPANNARTSLLKTREIALAFQRGFEVIDSRNNACSLTFMDGETFEIRAEPDLPDDLVLNEYDTLGRIISFSRYRDTEISERYCYGCGEYCGRVCEASAAGRQRRAREDVPEVEGSGECDVEDRLDSVHSEIVERSISDAEAKEAADEQDYEAFLEAILSDLRSLIHDAEALVPLKKAFKQQDLCPTWYLPHAPSPPDSLPQLTKTRSALQTIIKQGSATVSLARRFASAKQSARYTALQYDPTFTFLAAAFDSVLPKHIQHMSFLLGAPAIPARRAPRTKHWLATAYRHDLLVQQAAAGAASPRFNYAAYFRAGDRGGEYARWVEARRGTQDEVNVYAAIDSSSVAWRTFVRLLGELMDVAAEWQCECACMDVLMPGWSHAYHAITLLPLPVEAYTTRASARETAREEECVICKVDFADGEEVAVKSRCNHIFGRDCLGVWTRDRGTCPLCQRALYSAEDVIRPEAGVGSLLPRRLRGAFLRVDGVVRSGRALDGRIDERVFDGARGGGGRDYGFAKLLWDMDGVLEEYGRARDCFFREQTLEMFRGHYRRYRIAQLETGGETEGETLDSDDSDSDSEFVETNSDGMISLATRFRTPINTRKLRFQNAPPVQYRHVPDVPETHTESA